MYPFERYMKVLKGYVRKGNNVKGCIAECYVAEEALEYYAEYLKGVKSVGVPLNRNNLSSNDKGVGAAVIEQVDLKQLNQAHLYVLENTNEGHQYKEYVAYTCHFSLLLLSCTSMSLIVDMCSLC